MKYLLPILFSLPTVILILSFLLGPFLYSLVGPVPSSIPNEFPPQPNSIDGLIVFLPFLGFAACNCNDFRKAKCP